MKFLPFTLCVLVCLSIGFPQSEAHKPCSRAAATASDQNAREIILIGEVHGTEETPRLFGNLVTVATGENTRIGVGLELPIPLQRLIDEAVKNNSKISSFREQLLANPVWQKINDGRSSQAMLDLVCRMLRLAQGEEISLFFFDTQITENRDEMMAQLIARHVKEQASGVTYILTGNIHANTAPRHPAMIKIVPMGHWLKEQGFAVHSYDVRYSAGETWACIPDCGVHHLKGWDMKTGSGAIPQKGFDGILFVGPIHASSPARD